MIIKKLEQSFDFKGVRVDLTLAFNNIISFYELQNDERFSDVEKMEIGFNLVCKTKRKIDLNTKIQILNHVFEKYVNVINLKGDSDGKKVVDFVKDGGLIYSSFLKDYNIDLNDQIDVMDWRKFIWLFHGLSEKTKIKEVMAIRGKDIPIRTKYNGKEIENLLKLKTMYALEISEDERMKTLADSLKSIAERYIKT